MEAVALQVRIRFPAHHAGAAHIPLTFADEEYLNDGAGGKRRGATTTKTSRADVFRGREFFEGLAGRVGAAQFQSDLHAHTSLAAALAPLRSEFLGQAAREQVEVDRFREEARGPEILAIFLGGHTSLAGDDEDLDVRCVTERMQTLAEIKTGELGHQQVEKDSVWLMLHRQSQGLIRISGVKNLIRTFQACAQQAAHGGIVIHNQYLRHRDSLRPKGANLLVSVYSESFGAAYGAWVCRANLRGMQQARPS